MTAAFYQNETKFYVAVDCIILGFDQKELNVLLYKRKFEPMMGQWSLMGGFIKAGENFFIFFRLKKGNQRDLLLCYYGIMAL